MAKKRGRPKKDPKAERTFYVFHKAIADDHDSALHDAGPDFKLDIEVHDIGSELRPMTQIEILEQIEVWGYSWGHPYAFGGPTRVEEVYPDAVIIVVYGNDLPGGFDVWVLLDEFPIVKMRPIVLETINTITDWEFLRHLPG